MASGSRSRSRTKKASRMDAAHDHLTPFGFSKKEISSTVKSLLKVYGDEGWIFLEENGYKLVIETILEQKNANNEESTLPQLPAPPSPAPEEQNTEEQQQNRGSEAEMGMEEQMVSNRGSSEVVAGGPLEDLEIQFMDESLLHVIPPGRIRAPLYGYLSETDSDLDVEPAVTNP